jgi:hypothetical protein
MYDGKKLTLADITEPDVRERAGTLAVDTFKLVGADNDIGESGTILKDEDSAVRATIGIGVASTATVILLVAHITNARDGGWTAQWHNATNTGRNGKRLWSSEGGHDGSNCGGGEVHLIDWEVKEFVCGLRCKRWMKLMMG